MFVANRTFKVPKRWSAPGCRPAAREYLELPRDDAWIFLHLLGEQGSTHPIKRDYPSDR
jgi:hypothetical protein